jgi:uncharacterized protein
MKSQLMIKQPITYKLNIDGPAASSYYPAISAFTDQVLLKAENSLALTARIYRWYLIKFELETPRTVEEYIFDLLNLGILWRTYGQTALSVRIAPFRFLAQLAEWRKKHPLFKPLIDIIRGFMMSFLLIPSKKKSKVNIPRDLHDIERLVAWLDATGDFREDAFRYIRWLGYWATITPNHFNELMFSILSFTDWFEKESLIHLGMFTPNVGTFVAEHKDFYRWREDRFACLRSRVEYHLNMVGAEIMNRAFREEFIACKRKTVLAPGCMRMRSAKECEGTKTPDGIQCSGCESACHINQIRMLGLKQNFQVMVLPHSSDLSRWAAKPGAPSRGVVGVACLSVLVQGGWELKRYDVPAQCVLLNQCGCKKHWDREGFPTELDVRELKRIMSDSSSAEITFSFHLVESTSRN